MTHAQENMQSIETVLEQAQTLDLLHKIFNQLFSTYSKTQSNQVEREVGVGIGMVNTCKSMADSCQCMTKTTTIL